MNNKKTNSDDMRPEYDFSGGVRGKYAKRYAEGSNAVVIEWPAVPPHGVENPSEPARESNRGNALAAAQRNMLTTAEYFPLWSAENVPLSAAHDWLRKLSGIFPS